MSDVWQEVVAFYADKHIVYRIDVQGGSHFTISSDTAEVRIEDNEVVIESDPDLINARIPMDRVRSFSATVEPR